MDPEGASKDSSGWSGILAVFVANLYDAQVRFVHSPKYGKTLRFSGYKVDVEVARQTYVFIVNNMAAASRLYLKENRWAGRKEGNSFRSGYVNAVGAQIKKMIAEKQAEMQQTSSSRALVISKEQAVVERFGAVRYKTGRSNYYQSDAYSSGRAAGSRLDVGRRGISGGGSSSLRIGG
jgi:hypothetical protein